LRHQLVKVLLDAFRLTYKARQAESRNPGDGLALPFAVWDVAAVDSGTVFQQHDKHIDRAHGLEVGALLHLVACVVVGAGRAVLVKSAEGQAGQPHAAGDRGDGRILDDFVADADRAE